MNKIFTMVLAGSLMIGLAVQAQESSTTAASPESTSTTPASPLKAEAEKAWSIGFVAELDTNIKDQSTKTGDAAVTTVNVLSAGYKVSEQDKITVAGQFEYNSVPLVSERAASAKTSAMAHGTGTNSGYNPLDPYLAVSHSFKGSIYGADPTTLQVRYLFPTSDVTQGAGYRNGIVRFDDEVQWTLSKLVAASIYFNPRVYFTPGSPTSVSAREYAILYLNPTKELQFYQMAGILTGIGSISEGRKTSEGFHGETGLNYTFNKTFMLNLYIDSDVSMASSEIDRVYSADNTGYGLITQLTF